MFYLYVSDFFLGVLSSLGLAYLFCEGKVEYFVFFLPISLLILSFLRVREAKVRGRLKSVEREEFLKFFNGYDIYAKVDLADDENDNFDDND